MNASDYTILLLACTLFLSIDSSSNTAPLFSGHENQYTMMIRCTAPEGCTFGAYMDNLWGYFRSNGIPNKDVCTWRGLECTDGAITSILLALTERLHTSNSLWLIDPDWLPSTAQFVHLVNVRLVKEWMAQRLPRDLRYLHISNLLHYASAVHRGIKLWNLPQKMEEMHFHGGWSSGTLFIAALPQTMRLCFIHCMYIKKVVVVNADIPDSLEMFVVKGRQLSTCRMESHDETVVDPRVAIGYPRSEEYSEAFQEFELKCSQMVVEILAEQTHQNERPII